MVNEADPGAEGTSATPPREDPPRRSSGARVLVRVAQALAGLAVGCVVAEAAFSARAHGAFAHLNVYVSDAELGVRLRPGATERVAFGPNPVTSVRINAQGFRGADWPAPGDGEVLVVGDSQVFGLGVEETETTPAQLAVQLGGKTVLNGGVPTYGPPEYARVIAEVLEKRHPSAVVFVVNFANDLFEAARPNKDRHVVWDGWAVHRENAPERVTSFPGRELLFRESHAFYAARRFWYTHGSGPDEPAASPRHTWRDIALAGLAAEDEHEKAVVETERLAKSHAAAVKKAALGARTAELGVDLLIAGNIDPTVTDLHNRAGATYRAARVSPGEIVAYFDDGEYEEPVFATAEMIREGAVYRARLEELLRAKARGNPALASEVERTFQDRETRAARFATLAKEPAPVARAWSPVAPSLREVKALCDAHKARLFVVALPLDVQVSSEEWKKYGAEPVDMAPAELLVADVVDAALAVGATPIDATAALRAAEPGAFLYGDIHLTPKGHHALAESIVKAMNEPPPLARPKRGLPEGRTRVPAAKEWEVVREVNARGSSVAHCDTRMIHEWLRVVCTPKDVAAARPIGVKVVEGGHGEAFVTGGEALTALLVPVLPGDRFAADFTWADRTQRFTIQWAKGAAAPEMIFQKPSSAAPVETPPPLSLEPFCGCQKAHRTDLVCAGALLAPSPDCARTYGASCDKLLACADGDLETLPTCPAGQANAGATGRCYALCSDEVPCAQGACTEWREGRVCL